MRAKPFYIFSLAFFVGIFTASFVAMPVDFLIWTGISASVACVGAFHARLRPVALLFLGAIVSFSFGVLRFELSESDTHPLDQYIGAKTQITGIVCAEPEQKELTQRLCFAPDRGADRIIISAARFPRYRYGDKLSILGKLELPENFEAYEGGPEFDYISYLEKDGIRYTMSRPQVRKIAENQGNSLIAWLISVKSLFVGRIEALLPEPHSSLVNGLLLGEKGSLPPDVAMDFKRTGLTHILVLSGSNVTVVAESLLRVFSVLPRAFAQISGAGSIVLFALMTGASATTVRATFMALTLLFARGIGRRYDVTRALTIAAGIMLIQNPRILAFDISFQLSFLATIAIIYVSPLMKAHLGWVTERFGLRETLAMSLSTQIFTLPFILYKMGEISVIALVPNLLVLPTVPYAMLGGFVTGMVGLVGTIPALPFGWMTELLLSYMLKVVQFFGPMSFATVRFSFGAWSLAASYVVYIIILWRFHKKPNGSQG